MRSRYSLWIGILTTAGVVSVVSGCGGDSGSSPGSAAAQLSAKTAVAAAASSPAANLSASLGLANLRAKALLALLTQDEKLQLIHSEYQMSQVPLGGGGYIQGVPRLGIPDLNMVDSSTGGGSTMEPSTTFPATIAVAASWNRRLSYDYGAQIAKQLREQGFAMGLGGGTNLTREPRGGRTFE